MAGTQEPAEEGDPSAGSCVLWRADDPEDDDQSYVQMSCLACAQAHLVNPKTGKVLGSDDEYTRGLGVRATHVELTPERWGL